MPGLGSQYISINESPLPETDSFDIEYNTIENLFKTEAGEDRSIVVRHAKHKFSLGWKGATSTFKTQAEGFCSQDSVAVTFDGRTYACRARDLKAKLVKYSNRYSRSQGLWDISFTLEEF